jgi:parallel beta-helix repeat protein
VTTVDALCSVERGCRFAWTRAAILRGEMREGRMPAKLRLHAAPATLVSLAVILALAIVALVALSGAPAASAGPSHTSKVRGTWSDPVGACVAHIISFDPKTGDFVCTGTSHWTGTWTGSTTWTLTGNQSPTTGAVSGRIDEAFKGHLADGTTGTLTFAEHVTIDPDGDTDIRGSIVNSSGGLAYSQGHARWIGNSNPDGSGSGSYSGQWHQGQPQCGDTITAEVTLHHNLTNCPNNGLIIGADNVTLDLNYHTIDGNGKPAGGCDPQKDFCDTGIVNFGHDGVTVTHGSLREFDAGVNVFGPLRHNRLLDISSRNRVVGISLFRVSRTLIQNSSGNHSSSSPDAFAGLGVFNSDHVRVLHNSFRHNATDHGTVMADTNDSVIKGNRFSRNGGEGLLIESSDHNRISRNRLVRNGAGITLGPGSQNVIKRNRVFRGRDGIRIEKGHDNLVADNIVSHARRAGIRLGIPHPFLGGADNTVRGNLVKGSRDDALLVNEKDNHSLLRRNTARGAGDDGFDIQSHTAELTRNRALRNRDLGIAAVRGVNDGGGNIARHNGDPRQCTHIACG